MEADSITNGLARHAAGIAAGWLLKRGLIDGGSLEAVTGLILAVGAVAWSVTNKWRTAHAIDTALALPEGTTRTELKAAVAVDAPKVNK